MIITMVPYCPADQGMNLGYAYNQMMERLAEDDWACFLDHDACFTTRDWYRQLEAVVSHLSDPCVLTARTNRVGSRWQVVEGVDPDEHSIAFHRTLGERLAQQHGEEIADATHHPLMSGVVILLSKRTWRLLGGFKNGFLGVDNQIHQAARDQGYKVFLMQGVYVYHWYRADIDPAMLPPPSGGTAQAGQLHGDEACGEILAAIPEQTRRIVLVGCQDSQLIRALNSRKNTQLIGIEADPQVASIAMESLPELIVGSVQDASAFVGKQSADCVILDMALDRSVQPQTLLRAIRAWLKAGGLLLARFQNARHHQTVQALLEGYWKQPAERSDALRVFTKREVEKLLFRGGFEHALFRPLPNDDLQKWRDRGQPPAVTVGSLQIGGASEAQAEEFYARQYLVRAHVAEERQVALTSIIILTHNQLAYTHQCIETLRHVTDEPFELIVVDNGSSDGTVEYLRSLDGVTLITNRSNRGFPAAANQGIKASRGSQVLLLNNDVLVTTGWLTRLLGVLQSDPRIGLVGPCSNNVSGTQQVSVNYTDPACMDGFAWEWAKQNTGKIEDTDRLIGFCMLIGRRLIDEIGLLDERFGIGMFEDDDYSLRALRQGYRVVIAREAFVHHFGSTTFKGLGIDFDQQLKHNQQLFHAKWQGELPAPKFQEISDDATKRQGPQYGLRQLESGGLLLEPNPIRLSLCMIVRDSAKTLEACLTSISPWVDEMVVVDTGSNDQTPEIARRLGARVFHFPWCDDFSAARNESVRHARGHWIFWMDSDDTISPENGRKLRDLALGDHAPSMLGYVMQVHCPAPAEDYRGEMTVVDHVKLFRNLPHLRFDGRIHEQILPAIRQAGGEVGWTDLFVAHSGSDQSEEGRRGKYVRDLRILELELKERPEHPFTLFNLGMTYADMQSHQRAVEYLERSLRAARPEESHVRKIYALLSGSYSQLGDLAKAWEVCQRGLSTFPDDPELLFRSGVLLGEQGQLQQAVDAYLTLLTSSRPRHFSSIDQGVLGYKARQNLAVLHAELGQWNQAESQWRRITHEVPAYPAGWHGLINTLLKQGKMGLAEQEIAQAEKQAELEQTVAILKSELAKAKGDVQLAKELLQNAVSRANGKSLEPRRALCQLLFECGQPQEAETALMELIAHDPADAAARHNLATLYMKCGNYDGAASYYQQSLALRPKAPETTRLLSQALQLKQEAAMRGFSTR